MHWRGRVLTGVVTTMWALSVSLGAQAPTIEYDVKAAFLLNFLRFVEWPPAARRGQPFGLCTLEPDPFGQRLAAAAAGELWDGQPVAVRRISSLGAAECHLLYVPSGAMTAFRGMRREVEAQSILTVGESRDFLERGGMIQFVVEANRVRFSINARNAQAAGLRIGSRLLRLAKEVVNSESVRQ
jgi:hypothetical protein